MVEKTSEFKSQLSDHLRLNDSVLQVSSSNKYYCYPDHNEFNKQELESSTYTNFKPENNFRMDDDLKSKPIHRKYNSDNFSSQGNISLDNLYLEQWQSNLSQPSLPSFLFSEQPSYNDGNIKKVEEQNLLEANNSQKEFDCNYPNYCLNNHPFLSNDSMHHFANDDFRKKSPDYLKDTYLNDSPLSKAINGEASQNDFIVDNEFVSPNETANQPSIISQEFKAKLKLNSNNVGYANEDYEDEYDDRAYVQPNDMIHLDNQKTSIWNDFAMSQNNFFSDQRNFQHSGRISSSQPTVSYSNKNFHCEDYDHNLISNFSVVNNLNNSMPYQSPLPLETSNSAPLINKFDTDETANLSLPPALEINRLYNDHVKEYMKFQILNKNLSRDSSHQSIETALNSSTCTSVYSQKSSLYECNCPADYSSEEQEDSKNSTAIHRSTSEIENKVPTLPLRTIMKLSSLRMGTPRTPHTPICMKQQLSYLSDYPAAGLPSKEDKLYVKSTGINKQASNLENKIFSRNSFNKSSNSIVSSESWTTKNMNNLNVCSETTEATTDKNYSPTQSRKKISNNMYYDSCTRLKSMPILPNEKNKPFLENENYPFDKVKTNFGGDQNWRLNYTKEYNYPLPCNSNHPRENLPIKQINTFSSNESCKNHDNITNNKQYNYPNYNSKPCHRKTNDNNFYQVSNHEMENSVRLFVGKIPKWYTNRDLKKVFDVFGQVLECNIIRDRRSTQMQRCGFVRLANLQIACQAIKYFNQVVSLDKDLGPIQVKFASGELDRLNLPLELQPGGECVKLFFGNITLDTTEDELAQLFGVYGKYEELCILRDRNKRSKCSGFITFNRYKDAEAVIQALNGQYCIANATRPFEIRFAESRAQRGLKT